VSGSSSDFAGTSVMARGGGPVFEDDKDRRGWTDLLVRVCGN
jgi:hypothetical protein